MVHSIPFHSIPMVVVPVFMSPSRLVVFPRQWYAQRSRSDSHASSDVDQYQDAAEYLNLDLGCSPSSHPLDKPASTHTEYLNLIPGFSPFTPPDHTPSLGFGSADMPGVVVQDIEVSSDQDTSHVTFADQLASSEGSSEPSQKEVRIEKGGDKEEEREGNEGMRYLKVWTDTLGPVQCVCVRYRPRVSTTALYVCSLSIMVGSCTLHLYCLHHCLHVYRLSIMVFRL